MMQCLVLIALLLFLKQIKKKKEILIIIQYLKMTIHETKDSIKYISFYFYFKKVYKKTIYTILM